MEKSKIFLMIVLFIVFLLAGFWIGRNGSLLLVVLAVVCIGHEQSTHA